MGRVTRDFERYDGRHDRVTAELGTTKHATNLTSSIAGTQVSASLPKLARPNCGLNGPSSSIDPSIAAGLSAACGTLKTTGN